jgi:hypothetical protein
MKAQIGSFAVVYSWFQHLHNARVGVAGPLTFLQYPLYGRTLSNHVQYLGVRGPHGAYSDLSTCQEWQQAMRAGHYSYIFVSSENHSAKFVPSPEMKWMDASGNAKVISENLGASATTMTTDYVLYKVGPNFPSDSCNTTA